MRTTCKECGGLLILHPNKTPPETCSKPCRDAFNNRRKARGTQLYDLAMMNYVERSHPLRKSGDLRRAIDRLLALWRDEDRAAGRASYLDVADLIDCGTHINPRQDPNGGRVLASFHH